MSVLNHLNHSDDEAQECPLCMEFLELDDISFYPCSCGYQICRFCWNKIRTEGSGLCPACRSPYSENPADFKPLTAEEMAKIKAEKRQRDQAKKQKVSENRKHLANVRVVQRNLVFVVGLSPRLADPDVLKKPEYFGKFGKIHKAVINHSTSYAGSQNQGPSSSAYVTYYKSEDALRAIHAVNNIFIDGRTLKASLGTTKYCSHFMKNQTCPKHDCMYLHELGDEAASFSKEEMQQGKHTDYERALHDDMVLHQSSAPAEPSSERGEDYKRGEKASRSPSPKETWPNLATTPTQNSFQDRNGSDRRVKEEPEEPTAQERLSQEEIPEIPSKANESKHWSRPSSPDFLEEDDLGFDPFHETQKALAEMLESESKLVELKQMQMSRAEEAQHQGGQQVLPQAQQPFVSMQSSGRVKAPPPGFNLASNVHPGLHQPYSAGIEGYEPISSHMHQLHQAFPNPSSFGMSNHLGKMSSSGPSGRNSFFNGGGNHVPSSHGKDWQDGLRALLPNVNVSFGNLPNNYQAQSGNRSPNFQQFSRDDQELDSRRILGDWNSISGNDWTVLDPAIVGGQVANQRAESPNWYRSNVEQLTSDNARTVPNILPGFSNLSVSSNNPRHLFSQWNGQISANMPGDPPPGFGRNRGQMSHSYQNISSLSTNSDGHQIESKKEEIELVLSRL